MTDILLITAADVPVSDRFAHLPHATVAVDDSPAEVKAALKRALAVDNSFRRVVVAGPDSLLAAVVTRLLAIERLDIEVAPVLSARSVAANIYRPGDPLTGVARAAPLVRDDLGVALVGRAYLEPASGDRITGETFVDSERLWTGSTKWVVVEPTGTVPAVRARAASGGRHWWGGARWVYGRAAQTGAVGLRSRRDGVDAGRVLARATFYQHVTDWLVVG